LTLCTGLGVDDNYLYFVAEDVRKVSRATGEVIIIEKGTVDAHYEN
jgi:hypothetical protein